VTRGSPRRRWISLTFDECQDQERALDTLDALQTEQVPATFFLTGRSIEDFPLVAQRIADLGFEVGDHSYSHPDLATLAAAQQHAEIGAVADMYARTTGTKAMPLFRPPFGSFDDTTREVAARRGFPLVVLWSIDPEDWKGVSADTIEEHVVGKAHPGAIVLMHLGAPGTAGAIPGVVSRLRAQGYKFVPLSRLLRRQRLFLRFSPDAVLAHLIRALIRYEG
jgi:peptidoglycan/xylan/chitin deacetylase (PgdA/CDA1 family)